MKPSIIIIISLLAILISCKTTTKEKIIESARSIESYMDTTIHPGDDFFQYANGTWLKNNPIPADEFYWGIGNLVEEENNMKLRAICESSESNPSTPNTRKIGNYWKLAMDSIKREKLGLSPIKSEIQQINNIQTTKDLLNYIAKLVTYGISAPFRVIVEQDLKNSEKMTLYLNQGGLGLPNRDYYFNTDSRTTNIRNEYPMHISKMLGFLQDSFGDTKIRAEKIVALETGLAKGSNRAASADSP